LLQDPRNPHGKLTEQIRALWKTRSARPARMCGLSDGFDALHFRDVGSEVALDAHLEGHLARRAIDARAVQADLDGAVRADLDELDVASIGLDRGADEAQDAPDALVNGRGFRGLGHRRMVSL
jgi:hypothetical protein